MTNNKNKNPLTTLTEQTPEKKMRPTGSLFTESPQKMCILCSTISPYPSKNSFAIWLRATLPPKKHTTTTKRIKSPNNIPDTLNSPSRSKADNKFKTHTTSYLVPYNIHKTPTLTNNTLTSTIPPTKNSWITKYHRKNNWSILEQPPLLTISIILSLRSLSTTFPPLSTPQQPPRK